MKIIKRALFVIATIALYELSKYVTEQILISYEANDDIDTNQS